MSRLIKVATGLFLFIAICLAQGSASALQANSAAASPQAASSGNQDNMIRGAFATVLVKGVDSKKLKDGDEIICQTLGPIHAPSGLLIPTGSKVIGHVTQATARGKGDSNSTLAMVFDKIEITKGKEVSMKGTLQAVAPSIGTGGGPDTGANIGGSNMGKASGGGGSSAASMAPPNQTVGIGANQMKPGSHPLLNSQSEGALGYHDLSMDKNNVLTSTGKEVRLDNGTQMIIRAEIEMPVQ